MENIVYQGVRGKHGEQVLGHGETDMYPGGHRPTQKQAMEQVVGLCVRQGRVGRVQQPTGARQVAVPAITSKKGQS